MYIQDYDKNTLKSSKRLHLNLFKEFMGEKIWKKQKINLKLSPR